MADEHKGSNKDECKVNSVWGGSVAINDSKAKNDRLRLINDRLRLETPFMQEEYNLRVENSVDIGDLNKFLNLKYRRYPFKIITKEDIINFYIKFLTKYSKLKVDTIWRKIFSYLGSDNMNITLDNFKLFHTISLSPNLPFGNSLCGMPYGVWTIINNPTQISNDSYMPESGNYIPKCYIPIIRINELLKCNKHVNPSVYWNNKQRTEVHGNICKIKNKIPVILIRYITSKYFDPIELNIHFTNVYLNLENKFSIRIDTSNYYTRTEVHGTEYNYTELIDSNKQGYIQNVALKDIKKYFDFDYFFGIKFDFNFYGDKYLY